MIWFGSVDCGDLLLKFVAGFELVWKLCGVRIMFEEWGVYLGRRRPRLLV